MCRCRLAERRIASRRRIRFRTWGSGGDLLGSNPQSALAKTLMLLIDRLAEETIQAALRRGEFDDLPGAGKPLSLDDDSAVPESLRVAYRILRNAGCLPPEQQMRQEIRELEGLLQHLDSAADEQRLRRRLLLLQTRLALQGRESSLLVAEGNYREKMLQRMGQDAGR